MQEIYESLSLCGQLMTIFKFQILFFLKITKRKALC